MKIFHTSLAILALITFARSSDAVINISNNGVSGIDVEFTQPITFSINSSISNVFVGSILFEEWVTSDGIWNTASATSSTISISLNDGSFADINLNSLNDNEVGGNPNDISANDGQLQWDAPFSVVWLPANMTSLTIAAQTLTFDQTSGFNSGAFQTFSGNLTLVTTTGVALSTVSVVPEPAASAILMALSAIGIVALRRRRNG